MIPEELKAGKRWVNFRLMPDKDGGKPRKVPINPETGKNAASNKPETWTDYQTVADAVEMYGFSGIGRMFVKEDGFVGVDIDHCYDPQTGQFNEVAAAILARQPTFAEFSPSGDGVHLWFKGEKPKGSSKNSETGVEMYDSGRYFTVTGKKLPDAPETVAEDNGALAWIHENYVAKKRKAKEKPKRKKSNAALTKLTDEELLEKAQAAKGGDVFQLLWEGRWQEKYQSQSEADMALRLKLAFWSGKDKEQMDRLFRQSGLFRDKWDVAHRSDGTTYGQETLDKAIEKTEDIYNPADVSPVFEANGRYLRQKGDTVYPITNFVIVPIEMIQSEEEAQLCADLVTTHGEKYRLTFMTTDFANQQKFKNLLNKNTIALSYFGSDGDLELLKTYISQLEWTEKYGVKALGVYEYEGRYVFVTTEGSMEHGGTAVADIVQLEKYKSIQTGILSCDMLAKEKLPVLGHWLMSYNEPAKAISILAWCAGCFLKEHMKRCGIKFPHLFLIGEAGSGKSTTLEKVILPIFSTSKVMAATQVTQFTLMKDAASSNVIPLPLDEFKPSKIDRQRLSVLYNHFRDAYDGHNGVRGRADQTVVVYELAAPLVVAGEESADEAAIRERSVELLFSKKDLKDADRRMAFNRIAFAPEMLGDFGRSLLDTALSVHPDEVAKWHKEGLGKFEKMLPSRVLNNLACCYVGLKLLETLCMRYGYTWDNVFPYKTDACIKYLQFAAQDYLLEGSTHNRSIIDETFEIVARMKLDPKADYTISPDGKKLYIRLRDVYDRYTRYRKDCAIVGECLPYSQFLHQLKHSDIFLESNVQKWIGSENRKCWVIDYEMLKSRCDVSGFDSTEIEPM
ncbi:MAG: DNA primase [Lachnospiraceae bacterium]|nr:DNA primase [Lachnospiraceae bacterium]